MPAAVRLEVHQVDERHADLAEEDVGLVVLPVPQLEPQPRETKKGAAPETIAEEAAPV